MVARVQCVPAYGMYTLFTGTVAYDNCQSGGGLEKRGPRARGGGAGEVFKRLETGRHVHFFQPLPPPDLIENPPRPHPVNVLM